MITQAEIRELFQYEPEGRLRRVKGGRKPYPWRGIGKGARYLATQIAGCTLYLHQAVFLYFNGYIPSMVDHVDGNTLNNKIENLRCATNGQNQHNSRRKVNNKSGAKGVRRHVAGVTKKWQARIVVAGREISLGYFSTVAEASAAYDAGCVKYAGKFACPNSEKHRHA